MGNDVTVLVYAAIVGLVLLFFVWGLLVARSRGRSGLMWGLACALTWVVGIAILYSLGDRHPKVRSVRQASLADDPDKPDVEDLRRAEAAFNSAPPAVNPYKVESDEDRRWRYLTEYHPEVRKAVSAVSLLGGPALDELKAAHLAIDDPALLPVIVQRLGEKFRRAATGKRNGAAIGMAVPAPEPVEDEDSHAADADDDPVILEAPAVKPPSQSPISQSKAWPASWSPDAPPDAPRINGSASSATAAALAPKPADSSSAAINGRAPVVGQRSAPPPPPPASADKDDSELELLTESDADQDESDEIEDAVLADTGAPQSPNGVDLAPADATPASAPALERTTVTPSDLQGAKFLETYAGVHLFGLADGRIFVDRHEARASLAQARELVDKATVRRPGA